jgi:hypothetical protein
LPFRSQAEESAGSGTAGEFLRPRVDCSWGKRDFAEARCHANYLLEGEWNENNEGNLKAKLICHRCYETSRVVGTSIYLD